MDALRSIDGTTPVPDSLPGDQIDASITVGSRAPTLRLPDINTSPSPFPSASSTTSPAPQHSIIQPGVLLYDTPDPLDGKILLEERIGSGHHSDVYKGVWAPSDYEYRPVALKCIRLVTLVDDDGRDSGRMEQLSKPTTYAKRIVRETNQWTTMEHRNILHFYGYQTRGEELILVSTWSERRSLNKFFAFYPDLTIIDKLELLHEVASGLAYLHSLQPPIAHGGIKPENVIIKDDLHAALCDVGLSRVLTNLAVRSGFTTGGATELAGYQAKELYEEDIQPTSMSDVFAFGGLILTTISGKRPFWKRSNAFTIIAISKGSHPEAKDHPLLPQDDPLWETLTACWNTIAEKRPKMTEVIEQLQARIFQYEGSWSSDAPKRTRFKSATVERHSEATFKADPGSLDPGLSPAKTERLASSPPEESPFQPGAPIRDLLPQFKLEGTLVKMEKMGSGGYGEVFQGVWKRSNDQLVLVAIKSIKGGGIVERSGEMVPEQPDFMTRIMRETTIWKVAEHPNILSFYGYQLAGGEAMLVSPWCKHGSLNSYISKHDELQDTDKLKLLCDAARGLAYLHSSKPPIAHGDIKPENVIITDELKAALCDFGIARVMSDFTTGLTTRNPGAGTTRYQAKELLLGLSQPTNTSDVYAFGGLILATMSGKPPFHQHKTPPAIILAIHQDQTPAPAEHPGLDEKDPLWNLLRRCWSAQPNKRPTVDHVIIMLEAEIRHRSEMKADP